MAAALGDGYAVLGNGGNWSENPAKGNGSDGFEVAGADTVLTFSKAEGSRAGFDLNDLAGGTSAIGETNEFGTTSL